LSSSSLFGRPLSAVGDGRKHDFSTERCPPEGEDGALKRPIVTISGQSMGVRVTQKVTRESSSGQERVNYFKSYLSSSSVE
uniref:KID domain-containing protein n=1 Tax=Haemonchus placei TaxID=6290 RepID=A0A0N4WEA9_HAEPC